MDVTTLAGEVTTAGSKYPGPGIDAADIGVIVAYFAIILAVGIWVRYALF